MNEHARHLFAGKQGIEIYEDEWGGIEAMATGDALVAPEDNDE